MAGFKLTNAAVTDLQEIWIYTCRNWSVEQADRYYNLIMDEIEFLSLNPLSGRSVDFIKEGYYASKVKSHLVFYRAISNGEIEVIRILHQNMDVIQRIK
jgi:toxin ParE1/3/4